MAVIQPTSDSYYICFTPEQWAKVTTLTVTYTFSGTTYTKTQADFVQNTVQNSYNGIYYSSIGTTSINGAPPTSMTISIAGYSPITIASVQRVGYATGVYITVGTLSASINNFTVNGTACTKVLINGIDYNITELQLNGTPIWKKEVETAPGSYSFSGFSPFPNMIVA